MPRHWSIIYPATFPAPASLSNPLSAGPKMAGGGVLRGCGAKLGGKEENLRNGLEMGAELGYYAAQRARQCRWALGP
jgi:hypothetical protein